MIHPVLIRRNLIDLYILPCLLITPIPKIRRNSTATVLFRLQALDKILSRARVPSSPRNTIPTTVLKLDLCANTSPELRISSSFRWVQEDFVRYPEMPRHAVPDIRREVAWVLAYENDS